MQLSLQNFSSLVQTMAASVQSASSQLLDLTVGSVLRAMLEANASIALWMQWLILQVLQTTRAATSAGADLDSWMADFALARLPAAPASGVVTFSRFTPLAPTLVSVGALVRTADGTQTFAVMASPANPAYSAAQNGYVMTSGVAALDVPVQAQSPGVAGNVQAGSLSQLATAMPGVDAVFNAAAFQNGLDAESDGAFRARFANYLDSRSRATPLAVGYAISTIQQGLQFTIQENQDAAGGWRPGSFVVTVDDGSGAPSPALLATVASAIQAIRPVGSVFALRPPTVVLASVSLSITTASTNQKAAASAAVGKALAAFINALPIGAPLPITRLAQIAYAAHPAVTNVGQLSINGNPADVVPPSSGVVKAGLMVVN